MSDLYKAKCPKKVLFLALLLFATVVFLLYFTSSFSGDIYFIIASGRDILKDGFSINNPRSDGFIVVQQWLYCIFAAVLYDNLGTVGYWLTILLPLSGFLGVTCLYLRKHGVSLFRSLCFCFPLLMIGRVYLCVARPESLTLMLLVLEMIFLEKYQETRKFWYILLTPVLVATEMCVHMSMWSVHIAVLLAYSVPMIKQFGLKKDGIGILGFITSFVLSIGAVFLNPYGTDGFWYLYRFYEDKVTRLYIAECQPPKLLSETALILIICVLIWCICKPKKFTVSAFWLSLGFGILSCTAIRNVMFMPLAFIALIPVVDQTLREKVKIDMSKQTTWFNVVVLFIGMFVIGFNVDWTVDPIQKNISSVENLMANVDHKEEVFAGFNTGSRLEYLGFNRVYMDARPEIYGWSYSTTTLNDYISVLNCSIEDYSIFWYDRWSDDAIWYWIDYNEFTYMLVQPGVEKYLATYLNSSDEWKIIGTGECSGQECVLYEKVS